MSPVQTDLLNDLDPDGDFPLPPDLGSQGPARIIAMCNQKGGVGKTTTTINLAAALADYGRKVLIVDFDPQGAASAGVGINGMALERTLYDEMVSTKPDITRIIHQTATPNLDIVPSNIELSAAEIQLINEVAREQSLMRVLRPVVDSYDVIIVDCQPSLGLLTVNALTAAHGVMIPLEAEYFAMRGVALLVDQIERVQDRLNPQLRIDGVLLTMVDRRTIHAREVISTIREQFGDAVFDTEIPRTVRFPDATIAAEPITTYDPKSKGAESYRRLARELISRGGSP